MCRATYHTQVVICNMTCFTITAMSGDRFLALRFPLRYRYMVTARRVKVTAAVLWGVALATSLLVLLWMRSKGTIYKSCYYLYSMIGDGYKQHATIGTFVIILNICLYAGILWAMFCRQENLDLVCIRLAISGMQGKAASLLQLFEKGGTTKTDNAWDIRYTHHRNGFIFKYRWNSSSNSLKTAASLNTVEMVLSPNVFTIETHL